MRDNGKSNEHIASGTNSKMSEADCAQMLVKLKYFDSSEIPHDIPPTKISSKKSENKIKNDITTKKNKLLEYVLFFFNIIKDIIVQIYSIKKILIQLKLDNSPSLNLFNGVIYNCFFYTNKVLSPAEVTQNYNALKGRFGL
jgi:hypothetical protein